MDGLMLMNGVPSPIGARHHHSTAKVVALGPGTAGGWRAADALARQSYTLPLRLWRRWAGGAVSEKGSEEAAVTEKVEDSAARRGKALAADPQRGANWALKITRIKTMWTEKERMAAGGVPEAALAEEGGRCLGCGNGGEEDGSGGCVIDGVEEETMVFDRESFSRLLRKVSLVEAELYAKMAYLGSLAYKVSEIKPKNLLKRYGLRFVVSSMEKRGKSSAEEAEAEVCTGTSASAAYQIAASAASNLPFRIKNISEGSSENEQGGTKSREKASSAATTNSVTAVVAGKEDTRQAIAEEDLNSAISLPCEWYICDDDSSATRYFVIQGSETLASWQTNLLFEPVEFEGLNVPVHRGIYEAAKGMYQQMLPEVRAHLKSHGAMATFRFTGHSLGGSLALLVNLMLLIRGETPAPSLLPVITFGAPSIMCGGDSVLRKLGLPKHHVQTIIMHRDIVPRAFSCNYPDHLARILKAVNSSFRNYSCFEKQKLLYAPMGKLLILQPEETFSPSHHLLPEGSGLYILGKSLVDSDFSEQQLQAATLAFLNSPHPIEILTDRSAYGSKGALYRDHDTNSYLRSVRGVIFQEIKLIRKNIREQRRKMWWPLVAAQDRHPGVVSTGSVGPTNSTERHFCFASVVCRGRKTLKQFDSLIASHHAHMFVLLLLPARLLLLGALSLVHFR